MDKLKKLFKVKNKIMLFFIVLFIVGIISGSIFTVILSSEDKKIIIEYMNNYFNNLDNINYLLTLKQSILSNVIYVVIIWLLGISIIGIPLIFIIFVANAFILGFSTSSIILNFGIKGIPLAFSYIFPFEIINVLVLSILSMYAFAFSIRLIMGLFKHQDINNNKLFKKYKNILFICLIVVIINNLISNFILPVILKTVLNLIK